MADGTLAAQLNVRMSADLRDRGSAALESIGLTPSRAVRALWEKASRRGKDLEEIRQLLGCPAEPESEADGTALERGHGLWSHYMAEAGIIPSNCAEGERPYGELLAEALDNAVPAEKGEAHA